MDPDPLQAHQFLEIFQPFTSEMAMQLFILMILLVCSALISGAEVAFFSLKPQQISEIRNNEQDHTAMLDLIDRPKRLLATILIGNNLVNIGIVILADYVTGEWLSFPEGSILEFLIKVVLITFLILLFGEVIPKVYANANPYKFSKFMSPILLVLRRFFYPLSHLLIKSTNLIEKKLGNKGNNLSVDDLEQALNITENAGKDEHEEKILRGIVKFGNTEVKQIMRPRMDVTAVDVDTKSSELINIILDSGYSRIPAYEDNLDQVVGMLYIKDLLAHLDKEEEYDWKELLRDPFFVPEGKKIDDLLKEFQSKKIHQAIVVDEYGGTSGIVTLEDVIEEIVGDISDEFDDEDLIYSKLDEKNYVFEGKTPLNDFYRVIGIEGEPFEGKRGEADSLAGFILELAGMMPEKNQVINFQGYQLKVEQVKDRRIARVKVSLPE